MVLCPVLCTGAIYVLQNKPSFFFRVDMQTIWQLVAPLSWQHYPYAVLKCIEIAVSCTVQDLTCCLPEPGKSGPNPAANTTEHLAKLKLIVRDLVALSKCSFSQKVCACQWYYNFLDLLL